MGWKFGIPDFNLTNHFVYFNSLLDTKHNSREGAKQKISLWNAATSTASAATSLLNETDKLNNAVKFILMIANNERQKELNVIREYCKKTKKEFPFAADEITEEAILNNPENFYVKLTTLINKSITKEEEYINNLRRIQSNIQDSTRTLKDYKRDDYKFRLNGDISSLLNRLIGKYNLGEAVDQSSFSYQIQNVVMNILESQNIPQQVSNGANFAAIAASTLTEIEKIAQQKLDEMMLQSGEERDLAKKTKNILKDIEKEYLEELKKDSSEQSPIQKALSNIDGAEFSRITKNAIQILGIKEIDDPKKLNDQLKKINNNMRNRKKETYASRQAMSQLRKHLSKRTQLKESLYHLTFSNLNTDSMHGNLFELIEGLFGTKVRGNTATDIIRFTIDPKIEINQKILDEYINDIGESMSLVADEQQKVEDLNNRDLTLTLQEMNDSITKTIEKLEKKIKESKNYNNSPLFIFHESLKLYSSAETGRNVHGGGFGGRSMNIISFIDFMLSAGEEIGFGNESDRNTLIFLGLNLNNNAAASQAKNPLTKYFSIFSGLLMFDDITNMANEALEQIKDQNNKNVQQIHLYRLNGVYVPASMILSYVSNEVVAAYGIAQSGYGATASISVPSVNNTFESWKQGTLHGDSSRIYYKNELRPEHWQAVGSDAAASTKVNIHFLAAFIRFINKLAAL